MSVSTLDVIVPVVTGDGVVTGTSQQHVVSAVARDRIVSAATVDGVRSVSVRDTGGFRNALIVGDATAESVVARIAQDGVVVQAPVCQVAAGASLDSVVTATTKQ